MKKKTKTIFFLTVIFVVINIAIYSVIEINKQQRVQIALDSHLDRLQINYKTLIYHWKITADAAYKSTISMKTVLTTLSNAKNTPNKKKRAILRKELYNKLKNKFSVLKTKNVIYFSFVLSDNSVFLRMHKPEKFGDSITNVRYSIEYANKIKKSIHGYDIGKMAPAFRNSYPIFDNNDNHIGAIELSFSIGSLQEYFNNVSKMHTHFLINKNILDTLVWQKNNFILNHTKSSEHPNYLVDIQSKEHNKENFTQNIKKLQPIKKQIAKRIAQNKKFSLYTIYENKATVMSFYPIKDTKDNKNLAWIVSYEKDDFIDATLKNNLIIQIILFLILFILFYFIYKIINQKEILDNEVKEKTKKLAQTNNELKKNKYELQIMNENLQTLIKEEVKKNLQKEQMLFQQSKMASMGEMIGNIAHQWRQPLSVISMSINNITASIELEEELSNSDISACSNSVAKQCKHLSHTIDDFRNFFAPNKKKNNFKLKNSIDKTMNLLSASFKTHDIEVIQIIEDIEIITLENELTQAILNIINNAKDILITLSSNTRKLIFITIQQKDSRVFIEIKDNGGGIPKDIIDKIFEPYFTTKHKSQGTGIGLYMTQSIISKHLHGEITVTNTKYQYEGIEYVGAKFIIKI